MNTIYFSITLVTIVPATFYSSHAPIFSFPRVETTSLYMYVDMWSSVSVVIKLLPAGSIAAYRI